MEIIKSKWEGDSDLIALTFPNTYKELMSEEIAKVKEVNIERPSNLKNWAKVSLVS